MASAKSKSGSRGGSGASKSKSHTTTDREEIRQWVESRGGRPACVRGTGDSEDPGLIRIDYPEYSGEESLQPIDWPEWFEKFDQANLAFVYQDQTSEGNPSRFSKLVSREGASKSSARHGRSAR